MTTTNMLRYNRTAQALHWLIALCLLVIVPIGLFTDTVKAIFGDSYFTLHKSLGMTVFMLTVFRLFWRLGHKPPPYVPDLATLQKRMSKTVHILFYVLTLALPIGGYIISSAGKWPLAWFGVELPKLPVDKDSLIWELAHFGHENGGKLIAGLIVLHILAALYHAFKLRDGVIGRMVPGLR